MSFMTLGIMGSCLAPKNALGRIGLAALIFLFLLSGCQTGAVANHSAFNKAGKEDVKFDDKGGARGFLVSQ